MCVEWLFCYSAEDTCEDNTDNDRHTKGNGIQESHTCWCAVGHVLNAAKQMLSLPEDWDYTLKGLSLINREKIDAIREAIRELERAGYIVRSRERDEKGRLRGADYVIFEQPQPPTPDLPTLENPTLDNPTQEKPTLEKPTLKCTQSQGHNEIPKT